MYTLRLFDVERSVFEEVTTPIKCYMWDWDQKPAAPLWLLALNLSPSPSELFPLTLRTVCRPCCQRQQGLWPPGNRGVGLTHVAQHKLSVSSLSHLSVTLYLCYPLFPNYWLAGNTFYIFPCFIAWQSPAVILFSTDGGVFNAPLPTLELTPLFVLYSSGGVLHRPVLPIDVGTQAMQRDTLLERYSHGWNRVTAHLKIPWGGWAPPPAPSLSLRKECKDCMDLNLLAFSLSLLIARSSHTALYL